MHHLWEAFLELNIGLNIQGPGCTSTMTKEYSSNGLMYYCDASIKIIRSGDILAASVEAYGEAPFTISWNNVQEHDLVGGLLILDQGSMDILSATVVDASGCTVEVSLDMHGAITQNCQADFSYNILAPASTAPVGLSRINIEYTDPSGTLFRSKMIEQIPGSSFQIIDIKDYIFDEEGNPTKELSIIFNALLKSDDGKIINISDAQAIIAVSYPGN